MTDIQPPQLMQYEIRIIGQIPDRWFVWFEGMSLTFTEAGETIICGLVKDQAVLHGLIAKIRDLNLPLVSVKQIT